MHLNWSYICIVVTDSDRRCNKNTQKGFKSLKQRQIVTLKALSLNHIVHICEYSYSKLIFGRLYLVNSVSYIYAEAFLINGTGQMPIRFFSTSGRFLMKNGKVFHLDYFGQCRSADLSSPKEPIVVFSIKYRP